MSLKDVSQSDRCIGCPWKIASSLVLVACLILVLAAGGVLVYVVPSLQRMLMDMGEKLPLLTRFVCRICGLPPVLLSGITLAVLGGMIIKEKLLSPRARLIMNMSAMVFLILVLMMVTLSLVLPLITLVDAVSAQ